MHTEVCYTFLGGEKLSLNTDIISQPQKILNRINTSALFFFFLNEILLSLQLCSTINFFWLTTYHSIKKSWSAVINTFGTRQHYIYALNRCLCYLYGRILCFKILAEEKMIFQPLPDLPLLSVDILCGSLNWVSCILMNPVALEMKLKRIKVTLVLHTGIHKGF